MPNHIANLIQVESDEDFFALLDAILNEKREVDFNRLIPMPPDSESFNATEPVSSGPYAPPQKPMNWYDWSIANWGTKWNAYSQKFDPDLRKVYFETAWSCPVPVVQKLAEVASFDWEWRYADENAGFNYGLWTKSGPALTVRTEHLGKGTTDGIVWADGLHEQDSYLENLAPERPAIGVSNLANPDQDHQPGGADEQA